MGKHLFDRSYYNRKNVEFYIFQDLNLTDSAFSARIIGENVEFYRKEDYMIRRDKYLRQLISNRNNGFPKIITGIRRCGKSYLLKEIYRQYLIEQGTPEENILILELDEENTYCKT